MCLDLTRKRGAQGNKCGTLTFVINDRYEEEAQHVAFDRIDIDKQWVFSVGLYFKDAVCLLKC